MNQYINCLCVVLFVFLCGCVDVRAASYYADDEIPVAAGATVLYYGDLFYVTGTGRGIYRIYQDSSTAYQVVNVVPQTYYHNWPRFLHVVGDYLIFRDVYSYLPESGTLDEWTVFLGVDIQNAFTSEPLIFISHYRYSSGEISVNYKSNELNAFIETAVYPMSDAVDYVTQDNDILVCDTNDGLVHLRLDAFDSISLIEVFPANTCKKILQQDGLILTVDGKSLKKYQWLPDKTLKEVSSFTGA
jgi:hypothetical protein